mmetsp:Transcript_69128/g.164858  ORF Transcript_69128/g.164858 Transcript_69128/m.164858 type:complete len:303 (-) Transcript_69128:298-1206(-)
MGILQSKDEKAVLRNTEANSLLGMAHFPDAHRDRLRDRSPAKTHPGTRNPAINKSGGSRSISPDRTTPVRLRRRSSGASNNTFHSVRSESPDRCSEQQGDGRMVDGHESAPPGGTLRARAAHEQGGQHERNEGHEHSPPRGMHVDFDCVESQLFFMEEPSTRVKHTVINGPHSRDFLRSASEPHRAHSLSPNQQTSRRSSIGQANTHEYSPFVGGKWGQPHVVPGMTEGMLVAAIPPVQAPRLHRFEKKHNLEVQHAETEGLHMENDPREDLSHRLILKRAGFQLSGGSVSGGMRLGKASGL